MSRKRFIKLLMANGIHRNAANYIANNTSYVVMTLAGRTAQKYQITNCKEAKGGPVFTLKLREEGGGHV